MDTQLKNALAIITKKCKEQPTKSFYQVLSEKSLHQRVAMIRTAVVGYVDGDTINYYYTQKAKNNPGMIGKYRVVELTTAQKNKAIEELNWLLNDVEACIAHLKNA
jgi:hypothetical protein